MTELLKHPVYKNITYVGDQSVYDKRDKLSPGWYTCIPQGMNEPGPKFSSKGKLKDIGTVSFVGNEHFQRIMGEFEKSMNSKKWFEALGASYRRGFLLYGPPGTGKTTIQQEICNQMIESFGAMVIDLPQVSYSTLELASRMIDLYRKINPEQVFVMAMGDLNAGMFMNETLDSIRNALEKFTTSPTFWFATTNEFDKLDHSIVSRPGRFDTRIEIKTLPKSVVVDLCKLNFIEELAEELSKNTSVTPALIRELAIRVKCFGMEPKEAIKQVYAEFRQGFILESSNNELLDKANSLAGVSNKTFKKKALVAMAAKSSR